MDGIAQSTCNCTATCKKNQLQKKLMSEEGRQAWKVAPQQEKKIEMSIIRLEVSDTEEILPTESVCEKVGIIHWCPQKRA